MFRRSEVVLAKCNHTRGPLSTESHNYEPPTSAQSLNQFTIGKTVSIRTMPKTRSPLRPKIDEVARLYHERLSVRKKYKEYVDAVAEQQRLQLLASDLDKQAERINSEIKVRLICELQYRLTR